MLQYLVKDLHKMLFYNPLHYKLRFPFLINAFIIVFLGTNNPMSFDLPPTVSHTEKKWKPK